MACAHRAPQRQRLQRVQRQQPGHRSRAAQYGHFTVYDAEQQADEGDRGGDHGQHTAWSGGEEPAPNNLVGARDQPVNAATDSSVLAKV